MLLPNISRYQPFLFFFFFFAYNNYFRDKFLEGDISIRPQFRKVVFSLGYRKPSLFSSYHNEERKWNILNNENKLIFSIHLLFTPDFWQISELQIKKKFSIDHKRRLSCNIQSFEQATDNLLRRLVHMVLFSFINKTTYLLKIQF